MTRVKPRVFFCFMAGGSIPCSNKPVGKLRAEYPLPCVMPACFKRESKTRNHLGFRVAGKSPELKQRFAFGSATRRESSRRLCLTSIEMQKKQQSAPRRATVVCPYAPHYAASGIVFVQWPLPQDLGAATSSALVGLGCEDRGITCGSVAIAPSIGKIYKKRCHSERPRAKTRGSRGISMLDPSVRPGGLTRDDREEGHQQTSI